MLDLGVAYAQYSTALYRYARRRGANHEHAEDLVADVFAEALRRAHEYEDRGHPLSAWLFRIAYSRLIDSHRREKRRRTESLEALLADGTSIGQAEAPDDRIADRLDRRALLDRASLTPDQRQVLYLRFALGCDLAETAEAIGRSIGAVKALQHRAIAEVLGQR